MRASYQKITGALLIISALWSCGERALYDETQTLPGEGWEHDNILKFAFPITDTSGVYNVSLHVRNGKQYAYSNLWVFLRTTAPNGATQKDTLELILTDETGRWLGKGTRSVNTMLIPYMRGIKFPYLGVYQMELQHAMRDTSLYHVHDMGIQIQEVN